MANENAEDTLRQEDTLWLAWTVVNFPCTKSLVKPGFYPGPKTQGTLVLKPGLPDSNPMCKKSGNPGYPGYLENQGYQLYQGNQDLSRLGEVRANLSYPGKSGDPGFLN